MAVPLGRSSRPIDAPSAPKGSSQAQLVNQKPPQDSETIFSGSVSIGRSLVRRQVRRRRTAMRFMSLYRPALREDRMVPPTPDHMAAMGKLIADETKRGTLVSTGGLMSSAHGARVRRIGDDVTVTDGPFAETKELIGGYAILQVTSKAEAIDAAKRFIRVAGDGVCELRPFFGPGFAPREGTQLFMSLWRPSID